MTLNRTELARVEVDNSAIDGTGLPVRVINLIPGGLGGDASAANQLLENASLASIDSKLPALSGGRVPVELPAGASGLTDAQLRATPVPVSGTVTITDGSGPVTVDGTVAVSGTVPVSGPLTDTQLRATPVPVSGTVTITDGSGPVTVDGTVAVSGTVPVSGPLTDVQLRASAVPVSGPLTDAQLRATAVPVSGTVTITDGSGPVTVDGTVAISGTVPVSAAALPLPANAAQEAGGNLATIAAKDFATSAKQDTIVTSLATLDADLKAEIGTLDGKPAAYTVLDRLYQLGVKMDNAAKAAATEATLTALAATSIAVAVVGYDANY